MKLIVGLGNPGKNYENTRHNIGYLFLDQFAKRHNLENWSVKFNGMYSDFVFNNEKVILLKPLSYMNLSGTVVRKYIDYYKINIDDILIISDDMDLEIGTFRLRSKGSCGGHNGLRNIEMNLETQMYKRLKIGISNKGSIDAKDYVLGVFSKNDMDTLNKIQDIIGDLLDDFIIKPFDLLMNTYNHK